MASYQEIFWSINSNPDDPLTLAAAGSAMLESCHAWHRAFGECIIHVLAGKPGDPGPFDSEMRRRIYNDCHLLTRQCSFTAASQLFRTIGAIVYRLDLDEREACLTTLASATAQQGNRS